MYKTVERAIQRIAKRIKKEYDRDILDYLYDAADAYEYNFDGEKATCDFIINGLETEADKFVDLITGRE